MAGRRSPATTAAIFFVVLSFMGILTSLFFRRGISTTGTKMAVEKQELLAPVICVSHGGGTHTAPT
jgi:hypothetical protein